MTRLDKILLAQDKANHAFYGMLLFALLDKFFEFFHASQASVIAFVVTAVLAILWEIGKKVKLDVAPDPLDVAASVSLPAICLVLEQI